MTELGGDVPSFDELLHSSQPKDTQVIILEEEDPAPAAEQEGAGRKRKRADTDSSSSSSSSSSIVLEAHWVVLISLSPYFRTKLERWCRDAPVDKKQRQQQEGANPPPADEQQQQQPYQYSLQLLVAPGQLELGRRLISAMYSSSPDLSDLAAPQLMQLVALAECYGVGKVVTAAAAQLHQLSVDTMPLDTAAAVFELPEACLALAAFKPVHQTAASKLQQQLGDLEVVWGNDDKQQQLLGLPFAAVLQLLRDERTRVASEDTAVHTAAAWLAEHEHAAGSASQLLQFLRLTLCTATYLSDSKVHRQLRSWGLSEDQVCNLCAMCGVSDNERSSWLQHQYQHQSAWRLSRRPLSTVAQLEVSWRLKLCELQQAFEEAVQPGRSKHGIGYVHEPGKHCWQGRIWQVGAYVYKEGAAAVSGLFIRCTSGRACCHAQLLMLATAGHRARDNMIMGDYSPGLAHWAVCKAASWAELRGWLEQKHLVHPGDLLHCACSVTKVV